jgi:translation initiation factor IF-1
VAKEDSFKIKGQVTEALPNAQFLIQLETGQEILGHLAGKLRVNRITIPWG